jgi:hypothetical protein
MENIFLLAPLNDHEVRAYVSKWSTTLGPYVFSVEFYPIVCDVNKVEILGWLAFYMPYTWTCLA